MSIDSLQRTLGTQGLVCSAQGFGAMGLTAFYGKPVSDEHVYGILSRCVELGVTFIDTAEVYATKNDDGTTLFNEAVLGKAMKTIGREKFIVCTKHLPQGLKDKKKLREVIFNACNASLKRLQIDTIDLYYLHRMYAPPITIEDVMEVFTELVDQGKVKYLGLSEAPPSIIRRANAVHPISAIQQEWSLIARDLEATGSVVDTCRELGIGIVPYSPVARGFLSGKFQHTSPKDWRAAVPYLSKKNLGDNVQIVRKIEALAKEKGLTLSQLSLAWVMNQGVDVVPIPGTTKIPHLEENTAAANVTLTVEEMEMLSKATSQIKGERGNTAYMARSFRAPMFDDMEKSANSGVREEKEITSSKRKAAKTITGEDNKKQKSNENVGKENDKANMIEVITSDKAKPPIGPYSHAKRIGNTLYVSGQIGVTFDGMVSGGITEQSHQTLKNIQSILEAGGSSLSHVAKCQVLLSDIANYSALNQVYGEYFKENPPARVCYAVKDLPLGALVEIDAIAYIPPTTTN